MKVIELLNRIVNGEVPKKIKYSSYIFKYTGDKRIQRLYVMENQENYLLRDFVATLDSEVEIIEEKKIPEKLTKSVTDNACSSKDDRLIANTINEIIDYLKSKGEKND